MAYCTNEDVTDLTGTSVSTTIIDRLIIKADRKINVKLMAAGLGAITGTPPDEIIEASSHFAAALVLTRTLVDGTTPQSLKIENTGVSAPIDKMIAGHNAEGMSALTGYINENATLGDFKVFAVVGRNGERVGSYEQMTEAEENET